MTAETITSQAAIMRQAPRGCRANILNQCAFTLSLARAERDESRTALIAAAVEAGLGTKEAAALFDAAWTPPTRASSAGPYKVLVYHEDCGELIVDEVDVEDSADPGVIRLVVYAIKPGA